MPEAEVLYSDVKITKERGRANVTTSPPTETPYSEVRTFKIEPSTEQPGSQKPTGSDGRCSVSPERAALLVLCFLLVAAVVAVGLSSYKNRETMESLRQLREELEAVKRNLTEKQLEVEFFLQLPPRRQLDPGARANPLNDRSWERHRGKCYYFSNRNLTWEESRQECRRHGGDLVKIDSGEEQVQLRASDSLRVLLEPQAAPSE